jgi:uncharacterized membrane protein
VSLVTPLVLVTIAGMLALQLSRVSPAELIKDRFATLQPATMGAVLALVLFVITTMGPRGVAPFIYFQF